MQAVPLSLAATEGISVDFFSSGYLDVSVRRVRLLTCRIPHVAVGFPIRISPDQCLLPAPRGFSQATTSFFAFYRLGIHRAPLVTWPYSLKNNLLTRYCVQCLTLALELRFPCKIFLHGLCTSLLRSVPIC